jgi:spermidine/putrescine transport system ATP-binding protein
MSTLLTIDGICQRFGASTALDHISLAVQQGEFIALLGPSGCGKTTLLRTIAGFLTPTTGRILIEDQDISRLPPHRRPLNTVFQNYALFPHMTVLDNVMYGPRRQGVARTEAREQANDALDMVGLAAFGLRYPRELSGGQQQRVALARAIVNRPKLLLLDEPLSALDLKLRKRVQLELKHLQQKLGIAFLFVTHDQEEAMTMADRIVVMHDGRVEQVGTGADIYRRPATRFVAEFIGQANIIPYRRGDTTEATYAVGGLVLPRRPTASDADSLATADTGIAVLRPEDVRMTQAHSNAPGSQSAHHDIVRVSALITDLVSVGSHTMVHAQAGDQSILASLPGLPPERLASGQAVELNWRVDAMHLIAGSA